MKQNFLLLILSLFTLSIYAQDVPETQTPIVNKITATWCSNCGSWGWDIFEGLLDENKDKAIMIAAHYSGNLNTPVGEAFADNFDVFSQPRFVLNNEDQNANRNSVAENISQISGKIADMNTQSPVANVGFYAEMKDGKIEVQTKTKFFQTSEGEYYLSLYVLEDDVTMMQSGRGLAEHKAIMRTSFDTEVFGSRLSMMNMLGAGMEITGTHSIDIDGSWDTDNLTVVGMIWKKEGDKYLFVNANSTTDYSGNTSSTNNNFVQISDFSVSPTIITNIGIVDVNLSEPIKGAEMNLYSIEGRKIASIFSGDLATGIHTFEINRSDSPVSGMAFLVIEQGGIKLSRKIFFD